MDVEGDKSVASKVRTKSLDVSSKIEASSKAGYK